MEALGDAQCPEPRARATRQPYDDTLPVEERRRAVSCGRYTRKHGRSPSDRHIGAIELTCEPPLWATLTDEGEVIETKSVGPGEEEVVFVIDPELWKMRYATLRFRVVDARTGEPVDDAMPHLDLASRGSRIYPARPGGRHVLQGVYPGRSS
jgi:hypothetical protein